MDPERILPVQVPVEVTLPRATTTASLYRYSWHGLADVMIAPYFIILSDGVVGVPVGVCHCCGMWQVGTWSLFGICLFRNIHRN